MSGKTASRASPETIQLWGECLSLNFANTVDWDSSGQPAAPQRTDVLSSPDLLARWARRVGLFGPERPPLISPSELTRTLELRHGLHRLFSAIAAGQHPAADDLTLLRDTAVEATAAGELTARETTWEWSWKAAEPRRVRYAVASDAVALLGDADRVTRVARCPGEDCGWLFLNMSGRRRWCSMSTCGSRAKMRRMYARNKTG